MNRHEVGYRLAARRKITIALFFGLCVLPTGLVLALGLWRHRPGYVAVEAERLSRLAGLTVLLDDVEHPRPGVTVYRHLELRDPETGGMMLRSDRIEVGPRAFAEEEEPAADCFLLLAAEAEVNGDQINDLWRFVQRLLQRRTGWQEVNLRLAVSQATLTWGETSQDFQQIIGSLTSSDLGTQGVVSLRPAGSAAADVVQIRVTRERPAGPPAAAETSTAMVESITAGEPTTTVALYTGEEFLSTSLLGVAGEGFRKLGPAGQFRGYLRMSQTAGGWEGELGGELLGLDLDRLVAERLPHRLSGPARLWVEKARLRNGRLVEAAGSLQGGPGLVGRSLLEALITRLGLVGARREVALDAVPYDELAVSFYLDAEGLRLRGDCQGDQAGTIISDRYGQLLGWSAARPIPTTALIAAFGGEGSATVLLSGQSEWLLRRLPLPVFASRGGVSSDLTPIR